MRPKHVGGVAADEDAPTSDGVPPSSEGGKGAADSALLQNTQHSIGLGHQPATPSRSSGKKASVNRGLENVGEKRLCSSPIHLSFIQAHRTALLWQIESFANKFPFPKAKGQLYYFGPFMQ